MWPSSVEWTNLQFGIEIEFIGGAPDQVERLPGWIMALDERQMDETGKESGSELQAPPIRWADREQIRVMLDRLKEQGAAANWSCGLHVHVGLEPWGQDIVLPLIDAALLHQESVQTLMQTSEHRRIYCPPVTSEMRNRFTADPSQSTLRHQGRPQSHRCGINIAAWFDIGTVEFRYANGSLNYDEVINTIAFYLRFVAAIGEGRKLSNDPNKLAAELGTTPDAFPPSTLAPRWHKERVCLEEALIPILTPLTSQIVANSEILHILPVLEGFLVTVEKPDEELCTFIFRPPVSGWELIEA